MGSCLLAGQIGMLWVYVFLGICFQIADHCGYMFSWVSNRGFLLIFGYMFSCWFLGMCFLFCVWLTRDLLLGLCLCSCWKPICVFVFGWQERSTAGFVFVFLLEIGLCFVFLDLCSCVCVLVFCVLGLCSWICVLVVFVLVILGSGSGSGFFF